MKTEDQVIRTIYSLMINSFLVFISKILQECHRKIWSWYSEASCYKNINQDTNM